LDIEENFLREKRNAKMVFPYSIGAKTGKGLLRVSASKTSLSGVARLP
jgi:hypothetical protein